MCTDVTEAKLFAAWHLHMQDDCILAECFGFFTNKVRILVGAKLNISEKS